MKIRYLIIFIAFVLLVVINITKKDVVASAIEIKDVIEYKVDVKGEVLNPGVYIVLEGDRIIDVIEKAGGLKKGASTYNINLSERVTDEMLIIVCKGVREHDVVTVLEKECICNEDSHNVKEDGLVNINTATIDELISLPGIGESKAKAIIKYRNSNGSFKKIDDITNIPGIGDSTFANLKKNITT